MTLTIVLAVLNLAIVLYATFKLDLLNLGETEFVPFIKKVSAVSSVVIGLTSLFGALFLLIGYIVVVRQFDLEDKFPSWEDVAEMLD